MTDAGAPAAVPPARERGWARVAIAAALFLFLPLTPLLRILLPVDQTLVVLAPALAACALAGWWAGGRMALAVAWTALAAWILWQFTARGGPFALLACGWALLVASAFGALTLAEPEPRRPLFPRALTALAIAFALAGAIALVAPRGVAAVHDAVQAALNQRATDAVTAWQQQVQSPQWRAFAASRPFADSLAVQMERQLQAAPGFAMLVFPAMLALESLLALALAWALYHRVGRARIGPPLARLRDFRFDDQLVWGFVSGLVLVVVPQFARLAGLGATLLVFFGAVYAVRGMGIVVWFLAPGRIMAAVLIAFAVLFWHVVGVLAVGLGVGDTWLDWRRRAKPRA